MFYIQIILDSFQPPIFSKQMDILAKIEQRYGEICIWWLILSHKCVEKYDVILGIGRQMYENVYNKFGRLENWRRSE
jgi:hypothetical protein